jgi:hypothetical protein
VSLPADLTLLRAAVEAGERFTYRFFWGHSAAADAPIGNACLSQWWPCTFVVDGRTYTTAEQWMMAEKARLFGDDDALEQILSVEDPQAIKAIGRSVRNFDAAKWDAARFERVVVGNVHKFGSDLALRAFLRSTDGQVLVEAAPRDVIWGIGLGKDNPKAMDPRQWRGRNLLGFALMQARTRLA